MTPDSGTWTLIPKDAPGSPIVIDVWLDHFGGTEPQWFEHEQTLTVVWSDGRRKVYPWHAFVEAEYVPPTRATSQTYRKIVGAES